MSDFVDLSPNDYLFCPLYGVYFFETLLNRDILQKHLLETVEKIPLLSSVIVEKADDESSRSEGLQIAFKLIKPCNVNIVEKVDVKEDVHSLYKPDPKTGILEKEEGLKLMKYFDQIEFESNIRKPVFNKPNLKISLISTTQKKSVLFVCANHAIADAHSFALFMNTWGHLSSSSSSEKQNLLFSSFDLSREGLQMTPNFDLFKCIRPEMDQLKECHTLKKVYEEEIGQIVKNGDECVDLMLHFPSSSLQHLKTVAMNHINEQQQKDNDDEHASLPAFVSSSDCIAAYLWTIHTAIYGKKIRSRTVPFKIVVNFRSRFSKVNDSFFGNALSVVNVDEQYDSLMNASYPEIVLKIRNLINSIDDKVIQTTIDIVSFVAQNDIMYLWKSISRKQTFTMNDWRILDLLKPNFCDQSCSRMLLYPPSSNISTPTVATLHGRNDQDGIDVLCCFEKKAYDKFKHLNIGGDLESLQKIKKMNFDEIKVQ